MGFTLHKRVTRVVTMPAHASPTFAVLGFLTIALQRFGLELSEGVVLQATTVVLAVTVLFCFTALRESAGIVGTLLFLALVATTSTSSLLSAQPSLSSLMLLFVTFSPLILLRKDVADQGRSFLRGYVAAILLGAAAALVQQFLQQLGHGYWDPVQSISTVFLIPGFNSYYDLQYAGGLAGQFKPNGIVFLEPSFLSLYCGFAIVYLIASFPSKASPREMLLVGAQTLLAGAGLVVSSSSSGVLILICASFPLLTRLRRSAALLAGLLIAAITALQLGILDPLLAKVTEGFDGHTSTALRLTEPYAVLGSAWLESPLFGSGAGAAYDAVINSGIRGLQATTPIRVLVDFGIIGFLVFAFSVGYALYLSVAPWALRIAALAMWAIPADMLLNASLVLLLFFAIPRVCGATTAPRSDDVCTLDGRRATSERKLDPRPLSIVSSRITHP